MAGRRNFMQLQYLDWFLLRWMAAEWRSRFMRSRRSSFIRQSPDLDHIQGSGVPTSGSSGQAQAI
jgi:hypothetical protein